MAETVVVLRVLRRGERADALLDEVGRSLTGEALRSTESDVVHIRLSGRGPQAWEAVRDALDASGADWRQWLHLAPRPSR